MDPTRCLRELLFLFEENTNSDREEIVDYLFNLLVWLEKDGFFPKVQYNERENTFRIGE